MKEFKVLCENIEEADDDFKDQYDFFKTSQMLLNHQDPKQMFEIFQHLKESWKS